MDTWILDLLFIQIEFSILVSVIVISVCFFLSIHISWRRPLYYNLFLVEMHTWTTRRMVQVLHLGQEYFSSTTWDRFLARMRARAPRIAGEHRIAVSDTNIVIQSPNTVIESPTASRSPDADRITLWDIEMPPRPSDQAPDQTRDSQYAAAAAIAILARGDDSSLRSRVFFDNLDTTASHLPVLNRSSPALIPERTFIPGNLSTNETTSVSQEAQFVTTDVTYTTPRVAVDGVTRRIDSEREENEDENEISEHQGSSSPSLESNGDTRDVNIVTNDSSIIEENGEKVMIRLKFMNDTEKETYARLSDTIGKYKTEQFTGSPNEIVRLIYQGQLLRDDSKTLMSYGLKAGSVLHCHVSNTPYTRPCPSVAQVQSEQIRSNPRSHIEHTSRNEIMNAAPRVAQEQILNEINRPAEAPIANLFLMTLLPLMSALLLEFIRARRTWNRGSLSGYGVLWLTYQRVYNTILNYDNLDQLYETNAERRTIFERHLPTHVIIVFACQFIAVSAFLFFFPHVLDKTALTLLILLILYFIFVIHRNALDPEQIEQEMNIINNEEQQGLVM